MNRRRILLDALLSFLSVIIAFGLGFWAHGKIYPTTAHFPMLSQAYQIILEHGYAEIPAPPALEYGAIRGLVQAYGEPHTYFSEPAQAQLHSDTLSGSYGGIGAGMTRTPEGQIVLHPFADSPASEAGILDGDILLQVDDLTVTPEVSTDEVVAAVRGPKGKRVTLRVARPPENTEYAFEVKRAEIPLPSVTFNLDPIEPRLGVVRVNVIAASTPGEIFTAVNELQTRGATHFVLDLRGNGGGLLVEGVEVARLFLREGVVIEQQRKGEAVKAYEVKEPGPLAEIPLLILVDGNTASAAEIIAGALQVQERAALIGQPTFGKASIQTVFDLKDQSTLSVTSARWWVPGLEPPVDEGGLQPDLTASPENSSESDPALEAARRYFFGEPAP